MRIVLRVAQSLPIYLLNILLRRASMNKFKGLNFWLSTIILLFFLTGIANASVNYSKQRMISDGLTDRIKKDLSVKKLTVGIIRASDLEISNGKQALFGDAYYVANNERTPIYFEIIINTLSNKVSSVDYTFVENDSETSEIYLQKLIIKKLGNDYQTKNIVISIDNIEKSDRLGNIEKYRGTGEVRIGSLVLKKIKFEINLDSDSERILYKLDEIK
jgi:hypothetical protein